MGRLFWKFFFCIGLAQLTAIVGVSAVFWFERQQDAPYSERDGHRDGPGNRARPGAGALPDSAARSSVPAGAASPPPEFGPFRPPPFPDGKPPPPRPGHFPLVPLLAALIASLIFAALLARYVARPIRHLRTAFDLAAKGHLDVRPAALIGSRRDELADLGKDFERMAEQLHGLIDGQRRLLHDVSHELRSPLARLQAAIGLARQQPARTADSMARIERESVRMDRLVGELLTLSRLDAAAPMLTDDLAIADLLAGIVADARFEAADRTIRVELDAADEGLVHGNGDLLQQAIENVVRNAIKFSPPDTSVRIRTSVRPENGRLEISVCDSGPGVPADELEAIFSPFFRGSGSGGVDGHGLGLAITRRVAEAAGGSVRASNLAAGGLQIVISLPLYEPPA